MTEKTPIGEMPMLQESKKIETLILTWLNKPSNDELYREGIMESIFDTCDEYIRNTEDQFPSETNKFFEDGITLGLEAGKRKLPVYTAMFDIGDTTCYDRHYFYWIGMETDILKALRKKLGSN
jgi:hypothetical protein